MIVFAIKFKGDSEFHKVALQKASEEPFNEDDLKRLVINMDYFYALDAKTGQPFLVRTGDIQLIRVVSQ